jgi:hypothetical protein
MTPITHRGHGRSERLIPAKHETKRSFKTLVLNDEIRPNSGRLDPREIIFRDQRKGHLVSQKDIFLVQVSKTASQFALRLDSKHVPSIACSPPDVMTGVRSLYTAARVPSRFPQSLLSVSETTRPISPSGITLALKQPIQAFWKRDFTTGELYGNGLQTQFSAQITW